MKKLSLYIYQSQRTMGVHWEYPPAMEVNRFGWQSLGYYHPDVEVFIARSKSIKRLDHDLIAYHIMLALQDAHMSVRALRHEKPHAKKRPKKRVSMQQILLLPPE